jgi:hypothetical protein
MGKSMLNAPAARDRSELGRAEDLDIGISAFTTWVRSRVNLETLPFSNYVLDHVPCIVRTHYFIFKRFEITGLHLPSPPWKPMEPAI